MSAFNFTHDPAGDNYIVTKDGEFFCNLPGPGLALSHAAYWALLSTDQREAREAYILSRAEKS